MKTMKILNPFLFIIIVCLTNKAFSEPNISSLTAFGISQSIQLNVLPLGSGARALGMGGAFTAIADDGTAVSWNPAGLTNLETPEMSIVGSFLTTNSDFNDISTSVDNIDVDLFFGGSETDKRGDLNFASFSYPFVFLDQYAVAAISYQQVLDFDSEIKRSQSFFSGDVLKRTDKIDIESTGGVGAISPALAVQISEKVAIGGTINIYTDEYFRDDAWEEKIKQVFVLPNAEDSFFNATSSFDNFHAVNLSLGVFWDIWEIDNKRLTFGAEFDGPYTADVTMNQDMYSDLVTLASKRRHININMPMSASVGLAYQLSNEMTIAFDATWTNWSEWKLKEDGGDKIRPIGFEEDENVKINDTVAARLGIEYLIFNTDNEYIIPIRGGLFYEPEPSLGDPTDVIGFSIGSGVTFENYSLDFAYQFRYANNIGSEDIGIADNESDVVEQMFFTSLIVKF